jgi:5'-3' exoribonuclease 1
LLWLLLLGDVAACCFVFLLQFYRWISERYPKINQIISDQALLPEFDHLYLDMNGIIHGCTHPSDMDLTATSLSVRDMCMGIMQYLDRIITQIVKPRVSVYMAIDGVAPRAKLNQQRSRRFRSAKDMAEAHAANDGSNDSDDENNNHSNNSAQRKESFDSNCITPGTEFLAMVSETISYFIRQKLKEDAAWHGLTIIFSGHDIPGEGEHKIMQHIRQMRASPNYSPNTRHCIYGQDADLIMLGLVTHEPHFTILREVIDFNSFQNNRNALKEVKKFTKESDFQLLHLSVLREYLQIEFCSSPMPTLSPVQQAQDQQQQQQQQQQQPQQQQYQFDLERCIDDFVFMTFLVGNDFLPHLPTLDIGDGAFDLLFNVYKQQRSEWAAVANDDSSSNTGACAGPYMVHQGTIPDPARLESFVKAIGSVETDILTEREKNNAEYVRFFLRYYLSS